MASLGVHSWSTTAGNNVLANIGIQLSGSDLVSVFDNSLRQILADIKGEMNLRSGRGATAGAADAYTFSTTQANVGYATAWSAYVHGDTVTFEASFTNTGGATLSVDGLAAKNLRKHHDVALAAGDIESGGIYTAIYDSGDDVFQLVSPVGVAPYSPGGTDVALADGGTGASLADPGADRIMFWDDSGGAVDWLTAGSHLAITTTTIAVTTGTSGAVIPLLNGANTWSGVQTFSANPIIENTEPVLHLRDSNAAADNIRWRINVGVGGVAGLWIRALNDAESVVSHPLIILRTGTTIDEIELNATLFDFNGAMDLSGAATVGGLATFTNGSGITVSNTNPIYQFNETDAGSDEKIWYWNAASGVLQLLTRTDAGGAGAAPMRVIRTGGGTAVSEFEINATELEFNGTTLDVNAATDFSAIPTAAGDTLVGRATTDTLTNKTYSGGTLSGTIAGTPTLSGATITISNHLDVGTIDGRVATSSETTGTLTAASANRRVDMSGDVTIDDGVFTEGDVILLESNGSARNITQAAGMTLILGGTATTGSRTMTANCTATIVFRSSTVATVSGQGVA